ncbi:MULTISPECIES: hypothetical protein [Aliiglaciecola]|uniref:hypothetical protein n=1 Tax=Aliiglaciecola TaxID=1406885 RepID=UPI001C082315|nr:MULTISPECIES: hypothetical protein [Aliiglaciecola]MBU2878723.1 hypothetical protein [Aliiglaciecola lipolytica]MDO6711380.1 hypothetical protein [Aliiglaciecola sp. 2_MG-2023]MDO6752171.1 hypothetical protein [Aliiglaciecola sp. 1_MG-2023]
MSNEDRNKNSQYTMFKTLDDTGLHSAHITISNPTDLAIRVDTSNSGKTTSQLTIEIAGEDFDKLTKNWVEMRSKEERG